ncbi:hypothetical protein QE152_g9033 [Popillia japonica]|uniref:Uncharacterized protein n=1 Tax=Popillia japonica TaxID=7064 RepID=A0AAW1M0G5_POPJA
MILYMHTYAWRSSSLVGSFAAHGGYGTVMMFEGVEIERDFEEHRTARLEKEQRRLQRRQLPERRNYMIQFRNRNTEPPVLKRNRGAYNVGNYRRDAARTMTSRILTAENLPGWSLKYSDTTILELALTK